VPGTWASAAALVNLDEFGEGIKCIVPNVLGDLFTPDNLARVARQVLEQRVLFSSEFNGPALPILTELKQLFHLQSPPLAGSEDRRGIELTDHI